MTHIYLDYNASAPLLPESLDTMLPFLEAGKPAHNASSVHYFGRTAMAAIEKSRASVAKLIGADKNQIIFNSGATEGNNTVIKYFTEKYPDENILICATEHPSILEAEKLFQNVKLIPVNENGLLSIDILEEMLNSKRKTSLVSCQWVNNETGVIQNVSKISKIAHKNGSLFHCDATQAVGRITINMQENNIDFMTFSSHKIGGGQGAGALFIGICGTNPSLLFGGGQEKYLRSGTQNVAAISSFGAACEYAENNLEQYKKLALLRDKLENKLKKISDDITIFGKNTKRVPNTSFFSINNINAQNILIALDLENIAVSNGSACASGKVQQSPTLKAMGVDEKTSRSSLRISMGWATKESDIDVFLCEFEKIYNRIKNKNK